jgi:predicted TIM-barrel fold metal-dependent hydrolase
MERYRAVQRTLGTQRVVVVHTALFADNQLLLDTLRENADVRGIAIVGPRTPEDHWRELEACPGVRGVRVTTRDPQSPELDFIEPLAERIAPLGWHLQLHVSGAMLVALAPRLHALPCLLVVDHFGRLSPDGGTNGEEFKVLERLLSSGRVYCKLAAPNRVSRREPPYDDIAWLGRALVERAPERLVWGTDWPNSNWPGTMPDAGMLLDCLATWAPDAAVRNRILVDNPAALYGF